MFMKWKKINIKLSEIFDFFIQLKLCFKIVFFQAKLKRLRIHADQKLRQR